MCLCLFNLLYPFFLSTATKSIYWKREVVLQIWEYSMTTVSLPISSLWSSYFCAPHRSVMVFFFFLFVDVTCISVMRVHIMQVLKCHHCTWLHFGNLNLCICVETGSLCIMVPSVQGDHESSTCQWALPVLCCHCHTDGTDCSAASLHQPFSG